MPRKQDKAVPEGNDPVPQHDEVGPDQPTSADIHRLFEERLDRQLNQIKSHFDEHTEKMRETRQRSAGFEHDARQPRLAMEVDVRSDTKTRKRTEDVMADQAKHGDNFCAKRVDAGPPMRLTSGDDFAEPPALSCRDDAMVDKGAPAPKPCLSPVDMRTLTATGGLLLAGTASTATMAIFHQLPLWFCPTEDMNSRTSIQYVTTYYSSFWKVLKTKARQTLMFDPGDCTDHLRVCGRAARVAYWMGSFERCNGSRGWSVFSTRGS